MCLSLHLLGWAHSFRRFLGPQLGLLFSNLNWNLLGRIVRTHPHMNFSSYNYNFHQCQHIFDVARWNYTYVLQSSNLAQSFVQQCIVWNSSSPMEVLSIQPSKSWMAGRALEMKSLVVMVLPPGQVQDEGMPPNPLLPQGGPVTVWGWKVEPSRQVQKEGSTPRPQFGRLYLSITFSARSLIWKLFPSGQVHWSGRAPLEQGLSRYSIENGMICPLVHWHVVGGTPLQGFKLLLKILSWMTGLLIMLRIPPAPPKSPLRPCRKSFWGAAMEDWIKNSR